MPSSHGIFIEIIGDSKSYLRAAESTIAANTKMDASFKQVGINANLSADAQIKAAVKASEAMKANAIAMRAGVSKLPVEQQAAAVVAADAAMARYNRSIGITTASTGRLSASTKAGERDLGKMVRGTLAGSGAVAGLGRSLAFASGGFLAFAVGATLVTKSITAAEGLEKAQRSLDVAIQHTHGNLLKLRPEYLATAKAAAQFGITETDATVGLARATVLTGNAAAAQRAYQEALVISKATGKDFNSTLTATAKGQEGITTSLRRYGILVDKTTPGVEQFAIVMRRFGGQADANTTSLERLHAQFTNALTTIGTALLPTVNKLATAFGNWLQSMNDSGKLQADVAKGMKAIHSAATPLIASMHLLSGAVGGVNKAWHEFNSIGGGVQGRTLSRLAGFAKSGFMTGVGDVFPGLGFIRSLSGLGGGGPSTPTAAGPIPAAGTESPNRIVGIVAPVAKKVLAQYFKSFSLTFTDLLRQAQAQITKGTADDVRVAKQIIAQIREKIARGQLHGQALLTALGILASAMGTVESAAAAAAQKQAAAVQKAAAKAAAAFSNLVDPLSVEVELLRAEAAGQSTLPALRKLLASARKALSQAKSLAQQQQALQQIVSIQQQIKSLSTQASVTFVASLKLQLALAKDQALGRNDTKDLLKLRHAILKFIHAHRHNMAALIDAYGQLAAVNAQLASSASSALGLFRTASTKLLTEGLGLTPDQRRRLRARLSQMGPGGTIPGAGTGAAGYAINPDTGRPIVVHTHLNIDGKRVADNTTVHQQRHRRRNSHQRRGPNAGH